MLGVKGPRTGAPTRLRAIVQGLRLKLAKFESLCNSQEEEIYQLERDLRVTGSKELQIERDIFAGEFGRLQEVAKCLKKSKQRLKNENKEINHMKEKNRLLELANERCEFSIQAVQGSVDKANQDMEGSRQAAETSLQEAREMSRLYNRIQEHKIRLEQLVDAEKTSKERVAKRMVNLSAMITKTEKQLYELARKGVPIPGLKLRGGGTPSTGDHSSGQVTKASRIYGGAASFLVAVDQGCQTSVISTGPRCPSPMVPKLNLEKLRSPDKPDNAAAVAAAAAVEKPPAESVATVVGDQEVASKSSSKSSKSSKSAKSLKKRASPSPVPFSRPPSRLAFLSEATNSSSADDGVQPAATTSAAEGTSTSHAAAAPSADATSTSQTSPPPPPPPPPPPQPQPAAAAAAARLVEELVRDIQSRAKGGSRRLETVSEDDQLRCDDNLDKRRPCSSLGERRLQQQHRTCVETSASTNSYFSSLCKLQRSSSKAKATGLQKMLEVRSQRDLECLEWLQTLELPEVPDAVEETSTSGYSSMRPPPHPHLLPRRSQSSKAPIVFAEDTLQMMQLSRPAFELGGTSNPGDKKFVRRRHPP